MKKISAFFAVFVMMFTAGLCAHAAEINVTSTALPRAEAYTPYSYQIPIEGGNEGYTFTLVSDTIMPAGLSVSESGLVSGSPRTSGSYGDIDILISHTDGASQIVTFSIFISSRRVIIDVDSPENVVYDGRGHTATVTCYEYSASAPQNRGEVIPDVVQTTYGFERLTEATDAHTYNINVYAPGCSVMRRDGDDTLVISPAPVSLSITAKDRTFPYDGMAHGLDKGDITVNPAIPYEIEYRKQGTDEYMSAEPVTAGVYDARVYTTNSNYIDAEEHVTITITAEAVDFTLSGGKAEFNYGEAWDGTYEPSKSLAQPATVKYVKDGVEYDKPRAAGTYTVRITLSDKDSEKYQVGDIDPPTITVLGTTVNFTVTGAETEYDGTNKGDDIIVSSLPPLTDGEYTVSFRDAAGETVPEPTDAGSYTIHITMSDEGYSVGTITPNMLVISPKEVSFDISSNSVPYDGKPHTATVTSNDGLSDSDYTVQYRRGGALTDDVTAAGEYDIVITFPSGNYKLADGFSAKMTVTSVASLNIGNSPAAMIYNAADTDKDGEVNNFKASRIYNDTHYPKFIVPNTDEADFDADVNTVIVSDIDDFEDPGMVVNGAAAVKGTLEEVDGAKDLYRVTYNYDGGTLTRYVMVVGGKIGDANGDGYVNAIDGNYITANASDVPTTVTQARIWDVNKDGNLDKDDAAAIQARFKMPLTLYYPWVIEQ